MKFHLHRLLIHTSVIMGTALANISLGLNLGILWFCVLGFALGIFLPIFEPRE